MSTEQKENLDAILRQSAFPADVGVSELRRLLAEQASAQPLAAGVTVTAAALGGVPTAEITVAAMFAQLGVLPDFTSSRRVRGRTIRPTSPKGIQ